MLILKQRFQKNSRRKIKAYARPCNLCGQEFIVRTAHRCFCDECRMNSDLYRYHDWLPEAPPEISVVPTDAKPFAA